jgi:hypothetical protein
MLREVEPRAHHRAEREEVAGRDQDQRARMGGGLVSAWSISKHRNLQNQRSDDTSLHSLGKGYGARAADAATLIVHAHAGIRLRSVDI